MNITKKLDSWNEVLIKANMKVKRVADQASGEYYYEVAKYDLDNSTISNLISKIHKRTGVDMRFSFINLSEVLLTTKHLENVEHFLKEFKFHVVEGSFVHEKTTVADFKATPTPKSEYAVELDSFTKELISDFSKPEYRQKVKIVKSKSLGRGR
jgi:hypothetical protein